VRRIPAAKFCVDERAALARVRVASGDGRSAGRGEGLPGTSRRSVGYTIELQPTASGRRDRNADGERGAPARAFSRPAVFARKPQIGTPTSTYAQPEPSDGEHAGIPVASPAVPATPGNARGVMSTGRAYRNYPVWRNSAQASFRHEAAGGQVRRKRSRCTGRRVDLDVRRHTKAIVTPYEVSFDTLALTDFRLKSHQIEWKTMRTLKFCLLAEVIIVGLWAQPTDRALTNAEIESMLSAGLPESTILLKIQIAAYRGLVALDASSGALGALKQKGAGERILNAVLWAEPFGAAWKQEQAAWRQKKEEERAVPDLPGPAGVYVRNSSGWVPVESVMLWAPLYSGSNWSHRAHEYSIPLDNAHSGIQITEARPSFYVREPTSGEAWQIIRLASSHDQRLLRAASSNDWLNTQQIVPVTPQEDVPLVHVAGNIFTLRPKAELAAGEYVLCTGVPGGPGLKLCYSFGIRH
jgi:hypothetical protein